MTPPATITLHHGTTRRRAERIVAFGPDPHYVEFGGSFHDPAGGLSTYPAGHKPPNDDPDAEQYARKKARNFPNEGGPVILEVEVPDWIVDIVRGDPDGSFGIRDTGEVRFEPGMGLDELLQEWPTLPKRIVPL